MKILEDLSDVKGYIRTTQGREEKRARMMDIVDIAISIINDQQDTINALRRALEKGLKDYDTRVLTIEEALGTLDEVYFESPGNFCMWVDAYIDDTQKMAVLKRCGADPAYISLELYGKTWRCWNKKPTEEQRKDTQWA